MKNKIINAEGNRPMLLTVAEVEMLLNAAFTDNAGRRAAYIILRLWAGVRPIRNTLRHTALSYYYARFGDAVATAEWAGHSVPMMKHYCNATSREDAEKFWNMLPSSSK